MVNFDSDSEEMTNYVIAQLKKSCLETPFSQQLHNNSFGGRGRISPPDKSAPGIHSKAGEEIYPAKSETCQMGKMRDS